MSVPTSTKYLRRRRARRQRLQIWRECYQKATAASERKKILEKVGKIAPWLSEADFFLQAKSPDKKSQQ